MSELKAKYCTKTGQNLNYQTFSSLQIRPLLYKFFHSIHINLRDTSGEEIPIVSVGNTLLSLMFQKDPYIQFLQKSPKNGCYTARRDSVI